jgi:hypothetical protein
MHETCIYRIEVEGQVDERELNAMSPLRTTVARAGPAATLLTVNADQSGLIGLLRHLHGRGLLLLSVSRTRGTMSAKATPGNYEGDVK